MDNIFEIEDKSGRKVHLSRERWQHIVNEHPNVADTIEDIKDLLINPLTKKPSRYNEHVVFYYKFYKELSKYLLVSVKYLNGNGYVITAFFIRKLSK
ncbi:MAG: hypothetical protein AABX63_02165 [Nanoarchaeota archaeon]